MLDANIFNRLSAIDKAAVAFPVVGVALIGVTVRDSPTSEVQQIVYISLVVLAVGLVLYSVLQMRNVFVYAGQRKAIEAYTETRNLLPRGLFTWEGGPATEISGAHRLDGKANITRYIQPAFLILLDAGMCGYGLLKLQTFGVGTFWFIGGLVLSVLSLLIVAWAFSMIPETLDRVYSWTLNELEKNIG